MAKCLRRPMGKGEEFASDLAARVKRESERREDIFRRDVERTSAALQEERKYADPDQYLLEHPEAANLLSDDSRVLNNLRADTEEAVDESQPYVKPLKYGEQLEISGQLKPHDSSHHL